MLKKIAIITALLSACTTYCLTKKEKEEQAANILGRIKTEESHQADAKIYEQARQDAITDECQALEKQCTQILKDFHNHVEGKQLLLGTNIRKKGKFDFEEYEYPLTLEEAQKLTCSKLNDMLKTIQYMRHMSEGRDFSHLIKVITKAKEEVGCSHCK